MLTLTLVLVLLVAVGATVGMAPARSSDEPPATVTVTRTVMTSYRGVSATRWAAKYRQMRHLAYVRLKVARGARRTLMSSSTVGEAINLAAVIYGNGSTLWALARCESTLNPRAQNASGSSGLMQFMPSTFARTPYGRFSIWSPYASALAAGWMLQQGRRSEWVC